MSKIYKKIILKLKIIYKLRNSSLIQDIREVRFSDKLPKNVEPVNLDQRCEFKSQKIKCSFGTWEAGYRENFEILIKEINNEDINKKILKSYKPNLSGKSDNILLTTDFTLKKFQKSFFNNNFFELLMTTFYFTFFGTVGAILLGIFAAQLVNQKFYGRIFYEKYTAFPYVGPVVALAYTWTLLLDPNSGTLNSLLVNFGIIEKPINLLGQKYLIISILGFELKT